MEIQEPEQDSNEDMPGSCLPNESSCIMPPVVQGITQRAIDVYLLSNLPNGEIRGIGWWQSANGYTAIALHDSWLGSKHNYDILAMNLRACESRKRGFINDFNDDTLWWAICCLHVYGLAYDVWFLDKAKGVWKYVKDHAVLRKGQATFHDHDMEGACYWTSKPDEEQINSITTGLFAELGLRLAAIEEQSWEQRPSCLSSDMRQYHEFVESARTSLGWILRCRYRKGDAVVLDNILLRKQQARDWTFTYTTGVAIGVCVLLYRVTRDDEYLELACEMACKAMSRSSWVEKNGVLTERGAYGRQTHDPFKNNDAVGFKAVLMRHLTTLYDVISRSECTDEQALETAALIKSFIEINFQIQLKNNTNGKGQYGPWWNGPFEAPTSHSQMAVLDVMAAAIAVSGKIEGM